MCPFLAVVAGLQQFGQCSGSWDKCPPPLRRPKFQDIFINFSLMAPPSGSGHLNLNLITNNLTYLQTCKFKHLGSIDSHHSRTLKAYKLRQQTSRRYERPIKMYKIRFYSIQYVMTGALCASHFQSATPGGSQPLSSHIKSLYILDEESLLNPPRLAACEAISTSLQVVNILDPVVLAESRSFS